MILPNLPIATSGLYTLFAFSALLVVIYLFVLFMYLFYVAVGERIIIRKHARVCFYLNVVVSINKLSNLPHASLKSYLIMRVKWMRHGSVLPRAAVSLRRNKDGKMWMLCP